MAIQIQMPEEARFLAPSIVDQLRLGSKNDGGYVSPSNAISNNCSVISMGVKDDWTFESDLSKQIRKGKILCFDPTVSLRVFLKLFFKSVLNMFLFNNWSFRRRVGLVRLRLKTLLGYLLFFSHPNRKHIKKWCRIPSGENSISLTEAARLIPPDNEFIIKMDIEGDEYALLADFSDSVDFLRTRAFFVEFHEIGASWQTFSEVVKKLQNHFVITHLHANNCVRELGENGLPRFLEITFLRKDLVSSLGYRSILPVPEVDNPNKEEAPDFLIAFNS